MQILQCGYELNFNEYNHVFELLTTTVSVWQLEYLTDAVNGLQICDIRVVTWKITNQDMYSNINKFSWDQTVESFSVILNVLKETATRVAHIYTEGMKRLFSIFLFMTKLMQRGWDTHWSVYLSWTTKNMTFADFEVEVM